MKLVRLVIALAVVAGVGAGRLSAQATAASDGADLYAKNCRSCHGVRGTPPRAMATRMPVPKLDSAFLAGRSNDSLVSAMKRGGKNMTPLASKLTPEQMAAIAEYVRKTFAAAAPKAGQ
jgi:cytochrome c oxidase cbb3-type subunit 3